MGSLERRHRPPSDELYARKVLAIAGVAGYATPPWHPSFRSGPAPQPLRAARDAGSGDGQPPLHPRHDGERRRRSPRSPDGGRSSSASRRSPPRSSPRGRPSPWNWIATWLAEGGIAAGHLRRVDGDQVAHARTCRSLSGPIRKLVLSFSPAMMVGARAHGGARAARPASRCCRASGCCSTAPRVVSAGAYSVRSVPVMGAAFMSSAPWRWSRPQRGRRR